MCYFDEGQPETTPPPAPTRRSDADIAAALYGNNPRARSYCPGCEPEVDPTTEIVSSFPCGNHGGDDIRQSAGSDDAIAADHTAGVVLSGNSEAGMRESKGLCDLLRQLDGIDP